MAGANPAFYRSSLQASLRRVESSVGREFATLRGDYNAVRQSDFRSRRSGLASSGSSADWHYRSEVQYLQLIEYARDCDRNDWLVGQGVTRAVTNVLRDGMRLDVKTGDKALDVELAARWKAWSEDADECDLARERCWSEIEEHALRAMLVDGDCAFLGTDTGRLESIEAHRIRTPSRTKKNVIHGVLLSPERERLEYWISRDEIEPNSQLLVRDIRQVPVRDPDTGRRLVFHVYDPRRVSQTRGVTSLVPVLDATSLHGDLQFAQLIKAQLAACATILRETPERGPLDDAEEDADRTGERIVSPFSDGGERTVEGLSPGAEITGRPGEKLRLESPNVPNAEFFDHCALILTFVSVNLGIPLAVLLLDPNRAGNFSAWRGALDQARIGFRRLQALLVKRLHRPVWQWLVDRWMAEDPALRMAAAELGTDIYGHRWNPPTWPYIEPLKDAQADTARLSAGLTSPRRLHAERGADFEEIVEETIADNATAIRRAKREAVAINGEFDDGQPVHWRELVSIVAPSGVSLDVSSTKTDDDEGDDEDAGPGSVVPSSRFKRTIA